MIAFSQCKTAIAIAMLLTASSAFATTISKEEYGTSKDRIKNDYTSEKSTCATSTGNAKNICQRQAKGKQRIALSELEFSYTGKPSDEAKLPLVRADSEYSVAKAMCSDKLSKEKDVCNAEATAAYTKSKADAKLTGKIDTAAKSATQEKRDSNYKVAIEKCNSLSGEPKDSCTSAANDRFYKTNKADTSTNKTAQEQRKIDNKIATEKCNDLSGEQKTSCVSDMKDSSKKTNLAKKDGSQEKRDSDYKIATEKCNDLSGETKTSCISALKVRFNKT